MPTIYHWTQAQTVDQDRYNYLISRYGWFAKPTSPAKSKSNEKVTNDVGIRVPANWGQYWFPALREAMAGQGKAQVAWLGSSTMQGYYSTDLDATSGFAIVRDALQEVGGNGGSGFRGMQFSDTFLAGAPAGAYNLYKSKGNAWVHTVGAGSIGTPTRDLGPSAGYLAIAGGAYVDIPFTGSRLALWFFNAHTSSPFTYSIDGGSATTVTPGAGMGGDIAMISLLVATNLSKGKHSVRITGGTNAVQFVGIDAENEIGVVCNNYAIAGMQSHRYSNRDGYESGTYMGGHRFRNRYGVAATEETPDLLVIAVPPNDAIKTSETFNNASTTNASATVSHSGFRRYHVGRTITGTNIPIGTTLTAVNEGVSATMSANATGTASDTTITVVNPAAATDFVRNWEQYLAGVLDNVYGGGTVVEGKTDVVVLDNIMKISSDTTRPVWRQIEASAESLAEVYGAAYVNIGATLGQSWSRFYNLGYMGNGADPTISGSDDVHMSDKGHEYMASQVLKVILP